MLLFDGGTVLGEREPAREIIRDLMAIPSPTTMDLNRAKARIASKYHLEKTTSNAEIIRSLKPSYRARLLPLLTRKMTRTISGVTIIAAMTKPFDCPQTEPCAYCPGGPKQGVPQSYTGHEPAAMRGLQNQFDPYEQVKTRIEQLRAIGHRVDKVELIVMGGTFPATLLDYQRWFVQRCLDAITANRSLDLEDAKQHAESGGIHNVGITVETRPDWAKEVHIDNMLTMGVTRVEMGVQYPDDAVYRLVGRKHRVSDVVEATRIMKDSGLKVVYHMMPGLPGTSPQKDLRMFQKIFSDPMFKPDMIKIYPCLVLENTKIYDWYSEGRYAPYTTEEAVRIIAEMKKMVPPWVRIMRVQRDIPAPLIVAGVDKSNLRQLVRERLEKEGSRCRCIRCREVGHRLRDGIPKPKVEKVEILKERYEASEGEEVFISAEDTERDVLIGYLRLRIPSKKAHRPEVRREPCSIVRELHVYGSLVPVGKRFRKAWQHKGYGRILLNEAERVARDDYDSRKILIMSALGTKQYYERLGYGREGVYMSKKLED
jgi:elongator complex protein 3